MTSDLAAFLKARLDEDEAAANDERVWFGPYPQTIGEFEGHLVIQEDRVLREVAAKRAILAEHAAVRKLSELTDAKPHGYRNWVLRHLATVYSDHPDYDPGWKP